MGSQHRRASPGKDGKIDLAALNDAGMKNVKAACETKAKQFEIAQASINKLSDPNSFPDTTIVAQAGNDVVLFRIKIAVKG